MAEPTVNEIRSLLEGYGLDVTVLTDSWIELCRDEEIIPHVEDITRMKFSEVTTVTEYYNGNGKSVLILNRKPIVAITNIEEVGALVAGNLNDSVELIAAEGIIKVKTNYGEGIYGPIFRKGDKNIKVTYTYGLSDYPDRVKRAIKNMVAAKALALIGARTGGGSLTVQSHGRNYGSHGKYTDIRKELVASAYALLKPYLTGVTGG